MLECPISLLVVKRSAPSVSIIVPNVCREQWNEICFSMPAASAHLRRALPITVCVVGISKKGISFPLDFGNHRLASSERGIITGFSVFYISMSMYSPFPSAVLKMCIGARRYMSLNRNPVKQAKMKASLTSGR